MLQENNLSEVATQEDLNVYQKVIDIILSAAPQEAKDALKAELSKINEAFEEAAKYKSADFLEGFHSALNTFATSVLMLVRGGILSLREPGFSSLLVSLLDMVTVTRKNLEQHIPIEGGAPVDLSNIDTRGCDA